MPTIFLLDLHNDGRYSSSEPQCDHPPLRPGQLFRRKHRVWRVHDRQILVINGEERQQVFVSPADTYHD